MFIALALLINSKQPFMKWSRRPSARKPLVIFLVHIAVAAFILVTVFGSSIPMLLPLLVFPAAYLAMNRLAGEHFVLTEALGFVLLSLAAVLAKFTITGGVDIRLLVAVALYFIAGVFKVKAVLLKKTRDRVVMVLYVVFAAIVYQRFHIALIALLPPGRQSDRGCVPLSRKAPDHGLDRGGKEPALLNAHGLLLLTTNPSTPL